MQAKCSFETVGCHLNGFIQSDIVETYVTKKVSDELIKCKVIV
jgi:hypothetical protein